MKIRIEINDASPKPIYVQIQDNIINSVQNKTIDPNEQLPSINEVSDELEVARKTVEKAYNELKRKNIIVSVPGKGFFISENNSLDQKKVMLMFDIMNNQNNLIHQSFMKTMKDHTLVDFLVYHKDPGTFINYLIHAPDEYSHYVIMGHFNSRAKEAIAMINQLPKHKLIILDRKLPGIQGDYSFIMQSFDAILYTALCELSDSLINYNRLVVIFPKFTYYPKDMLSGIRKFSQESDFPCEVVEDIESHKRKRGDVFLVLTEKALASTVLSLQKSKLILGETVGIISYTDHPINEILAGGITAISPNFKGMGRLAAEAVLSDKKISASIDYDIHMRKSL
ncbi:MAG TPA: hypothetical protein DCF89_05260 [Flavobacteriales bacterium]|jgi:DNA-binding transcriptional regulator YhcF (GntR family)|nr:hypothetical protein [Crocinitomicaceae bacterium]HAE30504.1 hypothetical protein [Flavobacteriales bacterium]|tara:strand:+ start:539 stop:1555 length:1017 start_codon:yes stop_codon:yes gene_type:complete